MTNPVLDDIIARVRALWDGQPPAAHTHPVDQVTGLPAALDGKAPNRWLSLSEMNGSNGVTPVDTGATVNQALDVVANSVQTLSQSKADLVDDGTGRMVVPTSQNGAWSTTESRMAANAAARLALTSVQVQPGDYVTEQDTGRCYVLVATPISTASNWKRVDAAGGITSVNGQPGPSVVLAKGDLGLGNVDNTKDTDKPVSGPQAAAIAGAGAASMASGLWYSGAAGPEAADSANSFGQAAGLGFRVGRSCTLNGIGIKITTAGASTVQLRLAVLKVTVTTSIVSTLLVDAGTVSCDTTGVKTLTISCPVSAGDLIVPVVVTQGTGTRPYVPKAAPQSVGAPGFSIDNGAAGHGYLYTGITGAFPNTLGLLLNGTLSQPMVFVKAA